MFLLALAGTYLAFMTASHSTPFSPSLEPLLSSVGALPFAAGVVFIGMRTKWAARRQLSFREWRLRTLVRERRDIQLFCAAMLVVLVAAAVEGFQGNRDDSCRTPNAAACIKIDNWSEQGGSYFRQFPSDDPKAPWVAISRTEYVAEVGTRLRSAAGFALLALGVATYLSVVEEGMSLALVGRPRKEELILTDELPRY